MWIISTTTSAGMPACIAGEIEAGIDRGAGAVDMRLELLLDIVGGEGAVGSARYRDVVFDRRRERDRHQMADRRRRRRFHRAIGVGVVFVGRIGCVHEHAGRRTGLGLRGRIGEFEGLARAQAARIVDLAQRSDRGIGVIAEMPASSSAPASVSPRSIVMVRVSTPEFRRCRVARASPPRGNRRARRAAASAVWPGNFRTARTRHWPCRRIARAAGTDRRAGTLSRDRPQSPAP